MKTDSISSPASKSFITQIQKYGLVAIVVFIMTLFTIINPIFLSPSNLLNVLRQVSMLGIVAVGVTCVMITGGIDISVGSMLSLINVTAAIMMVKMNVHPVIASALAIGVGSLIGLINGLIITKLDVPPLIETLAMMTVIRGVSFILTNGLPVYGFPVSFSVIGQGYFLGIPIPVIIMAAIIALGAFVLKKTYIGRHLFAIGGNEEAARLSGIDVQKTKILVYVASGFLAGIAGIILLSRISSGQPNTGQGFEMDVVTAVVLGGVSISGGQGSIFGVLMGVIIMGLLSNGMIIIGVSEYYQWVVKGLVLIAAVALDRASRRNA
jgi:ribose transport system permease protein